MPWSGLSGHGWNSFAPQHPMKDSVQGSTRRNVLSQCPNALHTHNTKSDTYMYRTKGTKVMRQHWNHQHTHTHPQGQQGCVHPTNHAASRVGNACGGTRRVPTGLKSTVQCATATNPRPTPFVDIPNIICAYIHIYICTSTCGLASRVWQVIHTIHSTQLSVTSTPVLP
jgi:hypothetical protein